MKSASLCWCASGCCDFKAFPDKPIAIYRPANIFPLTKTLRASTGFLLRYYELRPRTDEVPNIQKVFHARVVRFKTAYPGIIIEAENAGQISYNDVLRNKIFEASQTPEFVSTLIDKVQSARFSTMALKLLEISFFSSSLPPVLTLSKTGRQFGSRFKGVSSPLLRGHDSQNVCYLPFCITPCHDSV